MPAEVGVRRRVSRHWQHLLERSPRATARYHAWRGTYPSQLSATTDLAICGPPGAGNTYLRETLLQANPGIDVFSHVHDWTAVANAVRLGVPTVMLVREVVDAVASRCSRFGSAITVEWALDDYGRLFERCEPFRDAVVVASFDTVTRDPGSVIRHVNQRFGTQLREFVSDDGAARRVVEDTISAYSREVFGADADLRGAMPSTARDSLKEQITEELRSPQLRGPVERCERAVRPFLAVAL